MSIKRGKVVKLFIITLILAIFGFSGYILANSEPRITNLPKKASVDVPAEAAGAFIREGATVEWDYLYIMCAHHIYVRKTADKSMEGLTLTGFQASFPDVRVVSFSPDKLALSRSFCSYCPDHYVLKRYGDELGVYKTVPGTQDQKIYIEIPVLFSNIAYDEKPAIETGKIFDSLDDINSYIKNIENVVFTE